MRCYHAHRAGLGKTEPGGPAGSAAKSPQILADPAPDFKTGRVPSPCQLSPRQPQPPAPGHTPTCSWKDETGQEGATIQCWNEAKLARTVSGKRRLRLAVVALTRQWTCGRLRVPEEQSHITAPPPDGHWRPRVGREGGRPEGRADTSIKNICPLKAPPRSRFVKREHFARGERGGQCHRVCFLYSIINARVFAQLFLPLQRPAPCASSGTRESEAVGVSIHFC